MSIEAKIDQFLEENPDRLDPILIASSPKHESDQAEKILDSLSLRSKDDNQEK